MVKTTSQFAAKSETGSGFVLTRRHLEYQGRLVVELWLATEVGPRRILSEPQTHSAFVEQRDATVLGVAAERQGVIVELVDNALKTFGQHPVMTLKTRTDRDFRKLRQIAQASGITLYEADIKLSDRFLMERFICGGLEFYAAKQQAETYINVRVKPADINPELSLMSVDIECDEIGELYSIGCSNGNQRIVFMVNSGAKAGSRDGDNDFHIQWCCDERELLRAFSRYVVAEDPDLIIGWNIKQFDMRVLFQRAEHLGITLRLGRGGASLHVRVDGNTSFVSLPGRVVICGIEALKSMTYVFESFSLNHVAGQLLGQSKAIENAENRLETIKHMFKNDKHSLARYNIQDCLLVESIFKHVNLIEYLVLRSKLTGLELGRPGGSVAAFLNLYLPRLHRVGYISPNRPEDGGLASPGGYVMNSRPGLYKHVLVLDFKSLYPSIIRTFKVDPLGLAIGVLEEDTIPGFKGAEFSRRHHFLPDIIKTLWHQRDAAKQQKNAALSQAIKIIMNSFYGVLGSGGCPFYSTQLASSITMRGHDIMQTTAKWIEDAGYDVIYGDTDSTFVWLKHTLRDEDAQKIGIELQYMINHRWQQTLREQLGLECFLEIEFETHFSQFVMPTIRGSEQGSKKRYAGLKKTAQGDEIVFKGLESVRSDWTQLAKDFQHELYRRVFADESIDQYVKQVINQTRKGLFDNKLVYSKRLRKPISDYTKSVPPHVKAAKIAAQNQSAELSELNDFGSRIIKYVITVKGPEPVDFITNTIDYEHYVDKQLRPIAESILGFLDMNFDALCDNQLALF